MTDVTGVAIPCVFQESPSRRSGQNLPCVKEVSAKPTEGLPGRQSLPTITASGTDFPWLSGRFYVHFAETWPDIHFSPCKVYRDMVKYTYHIESGTTIMSNNHQKSQMQTGTAAFFHLAVPCPSAAFGRRLRLQNRTVSSPVGELAVCVFSRRTPFRLIVTEKPGIMRTRRRMVVRYE